MNEPILLEDVQRLRLVPGDILVIRYHAWLTQSEIHAAHDRVKDRAPEGVGVLILDGGTTVEVLTPEPIDVIEIADTLSEEEFEEFRRRWTEAHV